MAKVEFKLEMDEALRDKMAIVCDELGLDMHEAFLIFARKISSERRIPFETKVEHFYLEENIKNIRESLHQIENGKVIVKSFDYIERMENE